MQLFVLMLHDLVFEFQAYAALVGSVRSSAVSKSLRTSKSRCFKVVGCSTRSTWFHKMQHRP
ncbi:hypothetical protein CGT92_18820 [Vibrio metoecus]|nr:hypothetical protein CGT95_18175 [Vibrio metoecus]PAR52316.1 hypothetical protein CGT92_18820 [Vibrio metoecus]PAR59952.1 hypothetical protein CGT91_17325 [Vibrio metoecus]